MKFIAKPMTDIPTTTKTPDPLVSDISVARLIDDGLLAIHREMKNLLMLGSRGKLDAANARDLRDLVKLLFELKDREGESLRNLTDDELKAKVKVALDENAE